MTQHVDTHFVTQASCCETTITLKDLLLGQFVVLKCSNLRAILLQQLPHFRQFSYNSAGNFSQPSMTISHLSICWRLLDIYVAHFCNILNLVADNFFLKTCLWNPLPETKQISGYASASRRMSCSTCLYFMMASKLSVLRNLALRRNLRIFCHQVSASFMLIEFLLSFLLQ